MTSTAMGFVLLMLRKHYPSSIRGMGLWGLAPIVLALCTVVYGLEHLFTPLFVVVVGNGLLMVGVALFYFGTHEFYGVPPRPWPWVVLGVLVVLWHIYFFEVHPDYRLRLSMFTGSLALLQCFHIALLWRRGKGFATRFTIGVLAAQTLVFLGRGVSTFWLDQPTTERFSPSLVQALYLAAYSFTVLLFSVGVLLMASERLRAEFEHQANHDSLTGAMARRAVLADSAQAFERWQRYGRGFALLMVDVDSFKQINDRHGHAVGDQVLMRVVQDLGHTLRAADRLGRYGGEEFLVLLPEAVLEQAHTVAERMRKAVARQQGSATVPGCTISIGLACVREGDSSLSAVLSRADAALYDAKHLGRNRVEVGQG